MFLSVHSLRPYSEFTEVLAEENSEYSYDINAKRKINFIIANYHMRCILRNGYV